MIHIATVHWKDDKWIDIQLDYLRRHIAEPFQVYAWLNDVPGEHRHKFHYVNTKDVRPHAIKLNTLADIIYFDSNRDNDLIIFMDGDAFPVGNIIGFAQEKLKSFPLVAVQRLENDGDVQPHPCFCITTIGFWKKIGGDWKPGYTWESSTMQVTDVGGNLLGILRRENINWYPLLRINRQNPHPLFFGVYEGPVYHHGAAFREPMSRIDVQTIRSKLGDQPINRPLKLHERILAQITRGTKWHSTIEKQKPSTEEYFALRKAENQATSDLLFRQILEDPEFYTQFL